MKKKILLILCLFLVGCNKKEEPIIEEPIEEKEEITKINNLTYEFNSEIHISDIVDINNDDLIDTTSLGEKVINIDNYKIIYTVVDTTPPHIKGDSIIIEKGDDSNLTKKLLCGDNYDSNPKKKIEGNYNINKVGEYNIKYVATDNSGNTNSKDIKLIVKKKEETVYSNPDKTSIKKYIKKYKKNNTSIGIDVSSWQGNIDYKKAKKDGVEFVIIRIGYGPSDDKNKIDSYFEKNLKNAKDAKVPVGLYFYSYAKTKEDAINEAKWIIKKLNGQKLDFPIYFDWENWSKFYSYKLSFYELNQIAFAFINEIEKNGYKASLYSSAYYLNHIWYKDKYDKTWLAYYTSNNDYEGDYFLWQLTSTGGVNGINAYVDIDIMYKNNE